jgi:hypothetical protein
MQRNRRAPDEVAQVLLCLVELELQEMRAVIGTKLDRYTASYSSS